MREISALFNLSMRQLDINELYGLILLNGFKQEKTDRKLDIDNLRCFCNNNRSIFLYFTEKQWIFIEAQYWFTFKDDSDYMKKSNEISTVAHSRDHINLKEKSFEIKCSDYSFFDNYRFNLVYKSKYCDNIQGKSYYLENNNLCVKYNQYGNSYTLPIFFRGEECIDYLYQTINA